MLSNICFDEDIRKLLPVWKLLVNEAVIIEDIVYTYLKKEREYVLVKNSCYVLFLEEE